MNKLDLLTPQDLFVLCVHFSSYGMYSTQRINIHGALPRRQPHQNIESTKARDVLKFSFSEKATKIWRNLPQGFDIT